MYVVYILPFPVTNDDEHIFMPLLPFVSILEKYLFQSSTHFSLVEFCCWVVGALYIFWANSALVPDVPDRGWEPSLQSWSCYSTRCCPNPLVLS